jgi:hypothetical protein
MENVEFLSGFLLSIGVMLSCGKIKVWEVGGKFMREENERSEEVSKEARKKMKR